MKKYTHLIIILFLLLAPMTVGRATSISVPPDSLVKASLPTIYYYANDGYRYVFPNDKTFGSWFSNFSRVTVISDEDLAKIPLKGNITYRPGVRLVKIQTDPKVYAVDRGGKLHWVQTEAIAEKLYGKNWNKLIDDIPDVFFVNYEVGESVESETEYNPSAAVSRVLTINQDKNISESASAPRANTEVGSNTIPAMPAIPAKPFPGEGVPAIPAVPATPAVPKTPTSTPPFFPPFPPQTPTSTPTSTPPLVTPAEPAIPATPATPTAPGSPGTPAVPATPASPAIPSPSTATSTSPVSSSDTTVPVITNVTVVTLTQTSATITWITNETAYSQVSWGATSSYGNETSLTSQLVYQHVVSITNLNPGTTYHFKVKSKDSAGNWGEGSDMAFATYISGTTTSTSNKVTVLWPNGGETLTQGRGYTIQWKPAIQSTLSGSENAVWSIYLYNEGTRELTRISPTNSPKITETEFVYTVSNSVPSGTYRLQVVLTCVGSPCADPLALLGPGATSFDDASDSTFTITAPPPPATAKVRLTYPNGGETLIQGNNYDIQWENPFTAGFPGDKNMSWWVTILRTNSGSSQGGADALSSSYKWYYVGSNGTGNDYKIRITLKPNCIWSNTPCPDPSTLLSRENLLPTWEYGDESDAAFSIVAPSDTTPPVIANFFIAATNITQTSAIINWTTNEEIKPIDNWVYWGTTANYGNITPYSPDPADPDFTKDHSIFLSGLTPNTTYHFKVKSTDLAGNTSFSDDHTFTTLSGQVLGESYAEYNPLGLLPGWFLWNKQYNELFYVDEGVCLMLAPNTGSQMEIRIVDYIPQGYKFCAI